MTTKSLPDDPATKYAVMVVKDRHPASDHVKEACERHLRDLEAGVHLWLPERGVRFEKFCQTCCVVNNPITTKIEPFHPIHWQQFVIYSAMSWTVKPGDKLKRQPGARRFWYVYLETAKGSGKSPLAAAFGLYILTSDIYWRLDGTKEPIMKPQCFAAASTQDQAIQVAMEPAAEMVRNSDLLADVQGCEIMGGNRPDRIICKQRGGFIQAIGTHWEGRGQAGLIVNFIDWEELHEQVTRGHVDNLDAGFKGSVQPLMLMNTNAGKQKEGMAWEENKKAIQASRGDGLDNYFAFIANVNEADIPEPGSKRWYPLKRHWAKANPSIGVTIRDDYIYNRVEKATTVADRLEVLRLNFGIWGTVDSEYINYHQWKKAEIEEFDESLLEGAEVYLAGDLAEKNDFIALAALFHCTDGIYRLRVHNYTAKGTLKTRDEMSSGHLLHWEEAGWIKTCDGSMADFEMVVDDIEMYIKNYTVNVMTVDQWRYEKLQELLDKREIKWWMREDKVEAFFQTGIEIVKHPMLYAKSNKKGALWMEQSINRFEEMVKGKNDVPEIEIEVNPVLRWNLSSAVILFDNQRNRRFDKKASASRNQGKIDGLVASVMAAGLSDRKLPKDNLESPWDDPNYKFEG